jgi:hypothetical protein
MRARSAGPAASSVCTISPVVGRRRGPIHGPSISQTDSYEAKRGGSRILGSRTRMINEASKASDRITVTCSDLQFWSPRWDSNPRPSITRQKLRVGLVGSRRIWAAHVGGVVDPVGSRTAPSDRLDDQRDDQQPRPLDAPPAPDRGLPATGRRTHPSSHEDRQQASTQVARYSNLRPARAARQAEPRTAPAVRSIR